MELIQIKKFLIQVNDLWLNTHFLLTSGDYKKKDYNTMTVAWGFFGIMWNKPIAAVVVRPTRYTYKFINRYETFSLNAFDKKFKKDLLLLGTKSGRDCNKIAETQLTITNSEKIESPSFEEAELIIECKKIYWNDFNPKNFLDPSIEKKYPKSDYHRIFYGEILEIRGISKYQPNLI